MDNNYFLTSPRIGLREILPSDLGPRYQGWLHDPEVNRFLETRYHPWSLQAMNRFVERLDGQLDEQLFAICWRETDLHIGNIKLGPINWQHRRADISLFIGDKEHWGKGVATETIALICEHAFITLNLNRVQAGAYCENHASIKAFEKCGFLLEGRRSQYVQVAGKGMDLVLLGLTADGFWERCR
ncbi:GNAT family N-acetyltransferase [Gallaecimonas kandeliae]|uniref:GNAT family N-acetyltransferase n=1 Tax=Gallaecimonas kandeliae TaxID=3029055 RepID=UPI002647753B|nr:GNAT family N-acetyltransferase [Gallaecimonas kandeliae]WKE66733.1 GNAT family N-acetyltransferase [Gallaecimonas kandeliae]